MPARNGRKTYGTVEVVRNHMFLASKKLVEAARRARRRRVHRRHDSVVDGCEPARHPHRNAVERAVRKDSDIGDRENGPAVDGLARWKALQLLEVPIRESDGDRALSCLPNRSRRRFVREKVLLIAK